MRLHPITWLMIFAMALRLAADAIRIAGDLALGESLRDGVGGFFSALLATDEREIAQTLFYLGTAASVELLHRVWRKLREDETLQ